MSDSDRATILAVDDEEDVADVYALRLQGEYDVEVAYGGEEALGILDERPVDVVLLDRRMPGISGDEVLDAIRERGLSTRVIMITAVEPDFDILEMPFDDYLCKPVRRDDLIDAIEQQLVAREYGESVDDYFALSSKIAVLEAEKTPSELEDSEEYTRLKQRAERLREEMDETLSGFDDMDQAFADINRSAGS